MIVSLYNACFQLGDRSLVGVTHADAVAALKSAGDVVELLVVPAVRSQTESLCGRRKLILIERVQNMTDFHLP